MRTGLSRAVGVIAVGALGAWAAACGSKSSDAPPPAKPPLGLDDLVNPGVCASCHPNHYQEWSGSMHAYASDDPIFRAMNKRLQRETGGALGTFCIQCHAPLAVKLGRTKDGLDIDTMPALKGVTCTFCHLVQSAPGSFNDPLELNPDLVLGAAIRDPVATDRPHQAQYVTWLDGTQDNQAGMCGSCHDIVTPGGAHIERTFDEWKKSRFGVGEQTKKSCASCHMTGKPGRASEVAGAPPRTQHDHMMVGVDVALTKFPEQDAQRAAVQAFLDTAIDARLCVSQSAAGATIDVALANRRVGHNWPSGSNQDRRAWIELTAYAGGAAILQTGSVPADQAVSKALDPMALLLRDHIFDMDGKPTELFWQAATFDSKQLPAQVTSNTADPKYDNSVHAMYAVAQVPDRVTMQVNIRPLDYDLIDELVASGDLDPSTIAPLETFTLTNTRLEWTTAAGACVGQ